MNNEEIKQQIADAIISGKIQAANIILGDNVQHKIEKVESGGIGIQIVNNGSVADENASVQQSDQPRSYCEYINREKLQEFNIYTIDEFEAMFAKATKGTAPELAAFLKKYRELKGLILVNTIKNKYLKTYALTSKKCVSMNTRISLQPTK